jgi:histidine triad (HIT) family protein
VSSVFSRIIAGELPARFVFQDERCVAFLSAAPLRQGHTLVVPRAEVEAWLDLPGDELSHLVSVAARVGRAIDRAFAPRRVGLMLAGLEVPHVHVHVLPMDDQSDMEFSRADQSPDPAEMDRSAAAIRAALQPDG